MIESKQKFEQVRDQVLKDPERQDREFGRDVIKAVSKILEGELTY